MPVFCRQLCGRNHLVPIAACFQIIVQRKCAFRFQDRGCPASASLPPYIQAVAACGDHGAHFGFVGLRVAGNHFQLHLYIRQDLRKMFHHICHFRLHVFIRVVEKHIQFDLFPGIFGAAFSAAFRTAGAFRT